MSVCSFPRAELKDLNRESIRFNDTETSIGQRVDAIDLTSARASPAALMQRFVNVDGSFKTSRSYSSFED